MSSHQGAQVGIPGVVIPVIIVVDYNTTYSTMYACLQLPILQYRAYYATI